MVSRAVESRTKAVVRDLPPTLPEDVFWAAVAPWVRLTDDPTRPEHRRTARHATYVRGKKAEQAGTWDTPSVAYIDFCRFELLVDFALHFHGHMFRDSKGHTHYAYVDWALLQTKTRWDSTVYGGHSGLIEHAPEFKAFIAAMDAPVQAKAEPTSHTSATPLVEFLRQSEAPKATAAADKDAKLKKDKEKEKRAKKPAGKAKDDAPGKAAGASVDHRQAAPKKANKQAYKEATKRPDALSGVKPSGKTGGKAGAKADKSKADKSKADKSKADKSKADKSKADKSKTDKSKTKAKAKPAKEAPRVTILQKPRAPGNV